MQFRFKLPASWDKGKLEDIATVQTGVAKGKKNLTDTVRLPYLRVANVQDGYLDLTEIKEIEVPVKDIPRYSLKAGDLLLTEGGDYDKLGRGHIWKGELEQCLHQNHVFVVRPNEEVLLPEFLNYYTSSFHGKLYFLSCAKQTTNLASINSTQLKAMPIPLPPLPEQKKIAEILSCWDSAIETIEKLIDAKMRFKKGLMQRVLSDRNRIGQYPLAGQRLPESSWQFLKLGEIGTTFSGLSGKSKDDFGQGKPYIPYLNVFQNSRIDPNRLDLVAVGASERQSQVKYGDVLFTTSSETPDEVGMTSVILEDLGECYLNSFCFGYRINNFDLINPRFARFLFRGPLFRRAMFRLAQGSTRFNLSKKEVLKLLVAVPSMRHQIEIAELLETGEQELSILRNIRKSLTEQKKGLMQQLLTGKIPVSTAKSPTKSTQEEYALNA